MQAHRNRVRANLSPFPSVPARAKILDIDWTIDDHRGPERHLAILDHAPQQGGRPIRADDLPLFEVSPGSLHHFPTGGVA